jgi:rhodanese-related sulfurtransferase
MKSLTSAEFNELLARDPLIVDIRPPLRFRLKSLPGSVNLDISLLRKGEHGLPKDRPVVLVCELGIQSELAGLYLEAEGFAEVYNLAQGLRALKF